MKAKKNIKLQNLKINFEYNGETISSSGEPYKSLNEIKEKALKKFVSQTPNNAHCFYLNKDISEKGNQKIGELFSPKDKIIIKLGSIPKIKTIKKQKLFSLSPTNSSKKSNFKLTNISIKSSLFVKNKKKPTCERYKNYSNKELIKLSPKKPILIRNKSEIFLPKNNLNTVITPKISENSKKNDEINKIDEELPYPCECKNFNISEYCRNCKKFICIECRSKQRHKKHLIIHLNMQNFEENIKKYVKIIQDDIEDKGDFKKNIIDQRDPISLQNLEERKEIISQKYENAIKNYKKIVSSIQEKLKKENKERASLEINAYNSSSQKINKQLNDLLEKLNKNYANNDQKMVFSDLRSFFDDINGKEETLNLLSGKIIKYHLIKEINTKLKSSIDKIERILEDNSNDQNLFNLDFKVMQEMVRLDIIQKVEEIDGDEESNMEKTDINNGNNLKKTRRISFVINK